MRKIIKVVVKIALITIIFVTFIINVSRTKVKAEENYCEMFNNSFISNFVYSFYGAYGQSFPEEIPADIIVKYTFSREFMPSDYFYAYEKYKDGRHIIVASELENAANKYFSIENIKSSQYYNVENNTYEIPYLSMGAIFGGYGIYLDGYTSDGFDIYTLYFKTIEYGLFDSINEPPFPAIIERHLEKTGELLDESSFYRFTNGKYSTILVSEHNGYSTYRVKFDGENIKLISSDFYEYSGSITDVEGIVTWSTKFEEPTTEEPTREQPTTEEPTTEESTKSQISNV